MGTPYTVQPGDSLSKIAQRHGYDSWEEIYNHDDNTLFRQQRPNPNEIHAGDQLILPDRAGAPTEAPPAKTPPATPPGVEPVDFIDRPGVASRDRPGGKTTTVLSTLYELRQIIVAQGLQAQNSDLPDDWVVPGSLETALPNNDEHEWESMEAESAQFVSHTQRVRFAIELVKDKDEYKRKLQTPDIHVAYIGHARFGRGPCFGPDISPGEDWEQGTDPNTRGIYRMGYPVILIPITDMEHHGYSFHPVPSSTTIRQSMCHPNVNHHRLNRIQLSELPEEIQEKVRPSPPQAEFWGKKVGRRVVKLLLFADWENTTSTPMDLGATDLRCRCFCHFGCSTKVHNWRIVRERKNWQRTDTDRFAYFTTAPSYSITMKLWLRAWLEYPRRNDFDSWFDSLEWARRRTNQLLRREGFAYSVW